MRLLIFLLLTGCSIHTGIGIIPDGPEWWEEEDPHFMVLAETRTEPVKLFAFHASSIRGYDYSLGYNLVGVSTTFEVGE